MELDLQSLFGLLCTAVHRSWDPETPPPPHLGSYTRALLVKQDRRHLFVTPLVSRLTDPKRKATDDETVYGKSDIDQHWSVPVPYIQSFPTLFHDRNSQIFVFFVISGLRIRIRIGSWFIPDSFGSVDPDPGGQKWPTRVEKNSEI